MTRWVGVDGCRAGWVAAAWDGARVEMSAWKRFAELRGRFPRATIAIDVPIGLEEGEGSAHRLCDREAAAALGARRSCVFPVPRRASLGLTDFRAGLGISAQTFGILPKIREVDAALRRGPGRVHEAHPELAFLHARPDRPPRHAKKRAEGRTERARILARVGLPALGPADVAPAPGVPRPKPDDVLDATILAWTARRIAEGRAATYGRAPRTIRA